MKIKAKILLKLIHSEPRKTLEWDSSIQQIHIFSAVTMKRFATAIELKKLPDGQCV